MDWRLVSLAFSLPSEAKVGVLGSKNILRASMEGILPEKIRLRKSKIGFASPLNQWIANHLKEYILDIVRSRSFQESTIWNGPKISADLEQALEKKDRFSESRCIFFGGRSFLDAGGEKKDLIHKLYGLSHLRY